MTPVPIWRRLLMHPYTLVSIVALGIMGIGAVGKHFSEWDDVYVGSARVLLSGKNIYERLHILRPDRDVPGGIKETFDAYTYPPFSAWLMIPFTVLPIRLARGIWYVVCVVSLVYLVKTAWRLAGGKPVEPVEPGASAAPDTRAGPHDQAAAGSTLNNEAILAPAAVAGPRDQAAFVIGHACALQLSLNALTHLQTDLPIAALLMAGCAAIAQRRFIRGSAWIGLAAAFKATPLLFAPWLLWRRQWRAAALLVLVAVGANLLPDTVHRPPAGGLWLGQWIRQYLQPMAKSDYVPGDWKNKLDNNQSLAGGVNRWLATTWQIIPGDFRVVDRPSHPDTRIIRLAFAACCLAVLLPAAWVMWRRRADSGAMLECGMILTLMVLLSPNSSRAHFCVLYLPAFFIARLAVRPGASLLLRSLLAAAVICSTLSIHIRIGPTQTAEQVLLWIGVVMLCAVFLLLAACVARMEPQTDG
jgi:hypothetical protein